MSARASARAPLGVTLCDTLCFPASATAPRSRDAQGEAAAPLLGVTGVEAGSDEASGFFIACAILASVGMGIQTFNNNYTAPTLALNCTAPDSAPALNCQLKLSVQS